jgi:hypothetical protein
MVSPSSVMRAAISASNSAVWVAERSAATVNSRA